jgi:protein-disulfide isomerase
MLGGMQRNRLLLLASAVGVALVALVVAVSVGSGGSSSGTTVSTSSSASVRAIFAGVPQKGDTLGRADAPVTLKVFEDPQCPFCREWNLATLPSVVSDYVRTGRVKLVYRGIVVIGPNSVDGLRAIYAAGAQNKLWTFDEALYEKQGAENSGWITTDVIREAAQDAHADADKILHGMNSTAVTAQLKVAAQEATADKVRGTPTFVIERPLAAPQLLQAPLDPSGFEAALAAALQ